MNKVELIDEYNGRRTKTTLFNNVSEVNKGIIDEFGGMLNDGTVDSFVIAGISKDGVGVTLSNREDELACLVLESAMQGLLTGIAEKYGLDVDKPFEEILDDLKGVLLMDINEENGDTNV